MDYRIKYTSFVGENVHEQTYKFSASDDDAAKKEHAKFKQKYESSKTFTRYLVGDLERIDQREITTRII